MSETGSSIVAETGSSITTAGSRSDIVYLPEPEVLITSNPMGERFSAISLSVCLSARVSHEQRVRLYLRRMKKLEPTGQNVNMFRFSRLIWQNCRLNFYREKFVVNI